MSNVTFPNGLKKAMSVFTASLIMFTAMLVWAQQAHAASGLIVNNAERTDTSGNPIWSQGGWMMQEGTTFYWYGMDFSVKGHKQINVYTSTDFVNWTPHKDIVDFDTINAKLDADNDSTTGRFAHSQWVGRPVVKYNGVLDKYVLMAEWGNGDQDGSRNKLTIFTSDSVTGPFTYEKHIAKPAGWGMGDLGSIYTDSDGSTYITYSDDYNGNINSAIRVSKLAPNFLSIEQQMFTIPHNFIPTNAPKKEASTLFKKGSKYMLLASRTDGWTSTETYCYSASNLAGPWSGGSSCATSPNSANSFDNQVDQVLPIQGAQGTVYLFIGDRWNNMKNGNGTMGSTQLGRNNWYPVTFDSNDKLTINGLTQWFLDPVNGTWSAPPVASPLQFYSMVNGNSNKAITVAVHSTATGSAIEQQPYGSSKADGANNVIKTASSFESQLWQLVNLGGGYYKLKNAGSNKVLGLDAGSTADGALNKQWPESGSANQSWSFTVIP
ncbi:RICIN domain-containing protein [Paenibacillus pasadenensis]|uniref:RICIN domain-containing protein n=1 Tax=Paenibacillus pasadenensis TaxID=217090 RepID=UPI0020419916|nr:RICIN domain-containing protein [Paenibacillus pasadenensis]MCM3745918.1 RICIN domain-containing protein [Paenibacillus pasadenensis]